MTETIFKPLVFKSNMSHIDFTWVKMHTLDYSPFRELNCSQLKVMDSIEGKYIFNRPFLKDLHVNFVLIDELHQVFVEDESNYILDLKYSPADGTRSLWIGFENPELATMMKLTYG